MLSYPPDFLYEMKCDVFYAEYTSPNSTEVEQIAETQDEFGNVYWSSHIWRGRTE